MGNSYFKNDFPWRESVEIALETTLNRKGTQKKKQQQLQQHFTLMHFHNKTVRIFQCEFCWGAFFFLFPYSIFILFAFIFPSSLYIVHRCRWRICFANRTVWWKVSDRTNERTNERRRKKITTTTKNVCKYIHKYVCFETTL